MKKSLGQKALPYLLISPTFILLFIFSYYTIYVALKASFQDFFLGFDAKWIGFSNYIALFKDKVFLASLINQAIITVAAVFSSVFFPWLAAELLFFIRHKRISNALKTAFVLPMLVPGIVTILIWRFLYNPSFGFNTILTKLGLSSWTHDWLNNSSTAIWCVLLVGFPFISGLFFLIYHSALNGIGKELHEAAYIDGAGTFSIVHFIHIPSIVPYTNVVFTLSLIGSLSGFGLIAATTNGGPGYSSMIPALYMYKIAFGSGNMGYASAMGVVMFVIIIVLTLMTRKLFKKKEE